MLIGNIFRCQMSAVNSCHGGTGAVLVSRMMERFNCVDFIDVAVVPPGSSIGRHSHTDNCEVYLVIQGTGEMTVGEHQFAVMPGDVILNPPFSEHSLRTVGDEALMIFVMQSSSGGERAGV